MGALFPIKECADGRHDAPNIFKFVSKFVKSQACYKRGGHSFF